MCWIDGLPIKAACTWVGTHGSIPTHVYRRSDDSSLRRPFSSSQAAIARGLAYAPYADLIWCETSTPDIEEAREFAGEGGGRGPTGACWGGGGALEGPSPALRNITSLLLSASALAAHHGIHHVSGHSSKPFITFCHLCPLLPLTLTSPRPRLPGRGHPQGVPGQAARLQLLPLLQLAQEPEHGADCVLPEGHCRDGLQVPVCHARGWVGGGAGASPAPGSGCWRPGRPGRRGGAMRLTAWKGGAVPGGGAARSAPLPCLETQSLSCRAPSLPPPPPTRRLPQPQLLDV